MRSELDRLARLAEVAGVRSVSWLNDAAPGEPPRVTVLLELAWWALLPLVGVAVLGWAADVLRRALPPGSVARVRRATSGAEVEELFVLEVADG